MLQTSAIARRFRLGDAAFGSLSWPAVAVAQPASTAILSIGDGDMICARLPIGLNIYLALVEAGLESRARLEVCQVQGSITLPWDFRRGRRPAVTPGSDFRPEMLVGRPEDIEPLSQAMISGTDGGDQFCC